MKNNHDNIQKAFATKDGGFNLSLTCSECGGKITHTDKYGMWCERECGRDESKKALALLKKMMPGVFPKGWDKNFK